MATQILFKIACPVCDAQMPVRDTKLVGRKVECPKCKHRFVVEEPEGYERAEADEPVAKKPKKKAKSNTGLMIGVGVGAVAVAVLAGVAFFIFRDDTPKPSSPASPPRAAANTDAPNNVAANTAETAKPTDAAATTAAAAPDQPPAKTETPVVAAQSTVPLPPANSSGRISNLLPNDSQLVVGINMDKLRNCTLGEQLFESKTGFRPGTFKEKIGIGENEMVAFVRGENTEQNWSFNVLRVKNPIDPKYIARVLNLKPGPKGVIKGRTYYEIPPNELLDHLTAALRSEIENKESREAKAKKKEVTSGPLGLMFVDETTLVFANLDQIEEFINADLKPRRVNQPTRPTDQPDSSSPPVPGGKPPGRGSGEFLLQQPAVGEEAQNTENESFLTVDPQLKAMMDRLDAEARNSILSAAVLVQSDPKLIERVRAWTGIKQLPSSGIRVIGFALQKYRLEEFFATMAVEFFNENDVKEIEAAMKKLLPVLAQALGAYLGGIRVETEGADQVPQPGSGNQPGAAPGGRPGAQPGNPSPSGLPGNPDEGPVSKLKLSRRSHYLMVSGELNLPQRAYDRIYAVTDATVVRMRGMVDMASPVPLWKELSGAATKLAESGNVNGMLRGTYPRGEITGGRLVRNWPPNQRVSWMVGLLPHLGADDVYRSINREKSWRDESNLKAGSILIPMFLDPRYPDTSWYARPESLGARIQGGTHYVGMAGVGLDAADLNFDSDKDKDEKRKAEISKRIGVFGYERKTSLKDVTDGASNTIYMIQVPPNNHRPWIAGGGATVMGAPDKNSIRPFVHSHDGKRGTYVLMLDGTVRFIKDDISDDVFKALCTIRGGEAVENLDAIAPKANAKTELKSDDKPKSEVQ